MKTNPASKTEDSSSAMFDVLRALLSRTWLVVLSTACALGGAYLYLEKAPRIYESTAIVQIDQQAPQVLDGQTSADDYRATEILKTFEEKFTTNSLLARVVDANKLKEDPTFFSNGLQGAAPTTAAAVSELRGRTTVKVRRGTRLIDLAIRDTDPERARRLTASLINESMRQNFEISASLSKVASEFLLQESVRLRKQLEESEQALQAYREDKNAVSLEERQNITVDKLRELNAKVTEAKTNRLKLESDLAVVQAKPQDSVALVYLPSVATSPDVLDVKKKITDQEALIANLSQRYLPEHPKYIQAQSQLGELHRALEEKVINSAGAVGTLYDTARLIETKLEEALAEQEKKALELNRLSIQYSLLAREVESDRALFEAVTKRVKETDIIKAFDQTAMRIVQEPARPNSPVAPRKSLVWMISAVAGIGIGVALALLAVVTDTTLRSVDQAEDIIGLPVLGAIPVLARPKKARSGKIIAVVPQPAGLLRKWFRSLLPGFVRNVPPAQSLVGLEQPSSPVAEAFRSLRAHIELDLGELGRRAVLFSSAIPNEGKSFCAVNHAILTAKLGLRTLLVDCDLRRPSLQEILGLNESDKGLGQHLLGHATFEEIIKEGPIQKLSVVPAGPLIADPAEALAGANLREFVARALKEFDRVIFDSAPVLAVSDALSLANAAAVILVTRAGKTPRRLSLRARADFEEAGAKVAGLVLNGLPAQNELDRHYYYAAGRYQGGYARQPEREPVAG